MLPSIQGEGPKTHSFPFFFPFFFTRYCPGSAMPMRPPGLWSETLLNSALKNASAEGPLAVPLEHPESDLQSRRMHESYTELVIPFASSPHVLEKYINATGGIRTGKVMEDLDSLAGSIAYKHMLEPGASQVGQGRGFYIVTASVERLDMLSQLDPRRDLRICGQVIYTGKSSMEVVVKMESIGSGLSDETVMIGRFSMVCRNARTHKAHRVHPLEVSTSEERALYALGDHMKERRKRAASQSLSQVPPSSSEAADLHSFYLRHGQEGDGSPLPDRVWMGETCIDNCMLMFPQERNVHSKVFGGYLMRLAYESILSRSRAVSIIDGIAFARPVPIGSILRLESMILHTTSTEEYPVLVHVGVKANVVDVKTGLEQTTNDFSLPWYQDAGC
ncbi:Thioesterase/thiol ester dehydrase-isomerase [Coprinopsis sp. MPI-PUGE-AT-0042]|nr:Thioesterase/thiol ester dehydrase-isomerase [Coprinopsis sp. MPI-PUGE-AT-0042]